VTEAGEPDSPTDENTEDQDKGGTDE
jgi:hypothetical protein